MGIKNKVSQEDRENARINRERQSNPPEVEPGMSDMDWASEGGSSGMDKDPWSAGGSDPWSSGGSSGSGGDSWGSSGGGADPWSSGGSSGADPWSAGGSTGADPWGSSGGWGGGFDNGGGFNQQNNGMNGQNGEKKEIEDTFFEYIGKILKGFGTFFSELSQSFKTFDVIRRFKMGKSAIYAGGIVAVSGLLLMLLGYGNGLGLSMLVGGLVSAGVGIPIFMFAYDNISKNGVPQPIEETSIAMEDLQSDEEPVDIWDSQGDTATDWGDTSGSESTDNWFAEDEDEEEEFKMFEDEDEEDADVFAPVPVDNGVVKSNMENNLANLDGRNDGMYTRKYLYDMVSNCLPNINPNFGKERVIKEGTEEFDDWDAVVQSSAEIFKPKGNDVEAVYLQEAKEKIFYIQLVIHRVPWIKNVEAFTEEIVNIYRADEDGSIDNKIYGIGNTVGDKIYVKIMKGETTMVSIKDIYQAEEKYILDTKNKMPVVLGLDIEGKPVLADFGNINSILITGMPRSGKTWLILSIITQMAQFKKPSELQFYILDPKLQMSDFYRMEMPHIRKFVSNNNNILDELRNIVRVEGPKRKSIIGKAGYVKIEDYIKANPDANMPYLYVIIDEVISLAETMDRNTKDEFQSLLLELVSQLPAAGIRLFMVPHLVKNDILKKTITQLIPCRVSVLGDAEHIENTTGTKPKDFKHTLVHQGDLALKLNNDQTTFVHSAVISTDENNANAEYFDYLRKLWSKLEPESMEGSVYNVRHNVPSGEKGKIVNQLLSEDLEPSEELFNQHQSKGGTETLIPEATSKIGNSNYLDFANPVGKDISETFDILDEGEDEEEIDIFATPEEPSKSEPVKPITETIQNSNTLQKHKSNNVEFDFEASKNNAEFFPNKGVQKKSLSADDINSLLSMPDSDSLPESTNLNVDNRKTNTNSPTTKDNEVDWFKEGTFNNKNTNEDDLWGDI